MSKLTNMSVGVAVSPNPLRVERKDRSRHRYSTQPWMAWYRSKRWSDLRMRVFNRDGFTCQHPGCGYLGVHKTSSLIAHHKIPHKGNVELFWNENMIETVCKPCHDGVIQSIEKKQQMVGG